MKLPGRKDGPCERRETVERVGSLSCPAIQKAIERGLETGPVMFQAFWIFAGGKLPDANRPPAPVGLAADKIIRDRL